LALDKNVGKGKLICKVGNLALLMEDFGTGAPNFRFVVVDDKDNVQAGAYVDLVGTIFLTKCMENAVNEAMSYNIKSGTFEEKEVG
jgi:hypothetical protein